MKIIAFSFTSAGRGIGQELEKIKNLNIKHWANKDLDGGVKSFLEEAWQEYEGIIFISASGIAVRYIAPYLQHKSKDPAVLFIDDQAKYVVSLLSGHLGGANELADKLAEDLGAQAVISTASDSRGFQALDLFAQENNYYIEDFKSLAKLSSLMVDGQNLAFYSQMGDLIDYPKTVYLDSLSDWKEIDGELPGILLVTSNLVEVDGDRPYSILRPRNINIGIGCRRGMSAKRIIQAIEETLDGLGISRRSIKALASVEIKKDEEGIIQAAQYFSCPFKIFSLEEIGQVDYMFSKSEFVKDQIGVYSVAEPSAYLLGGEFLLKKTSYSGITISITREDKNG